MTHPHSARQASLPATQFRRREHSAERNGVVALPELIDLRLPERHMISRASLDRIRSRQRTIRLAHGIYVARPAFEALGPRSQHALRCIALERTLRTEYVFSHASAAVFHGLPLLSLPAKIHVTRPRTKGGTIPGVVRHGSADILPKAVLMGPGLPATDLIRTALDCARMGGFSQAVVLFDYVLRLAALGYLATTAPYTREWFGIAIPEGARGLARGQTFTWYDVGTQLPTGWLADEQRSEVIRGVLLQAIEDLGPAWGIRAAKRAAQFASPLAESPLESYGRVKLLEQGIVIPALQFEVRTSAGHLFRADGAFPDERVIIEFDGQGKYGHEFDWTSRALTDERQREKELTNDDWRVLRFTWDDFRRDASRVATVVKQAVHRPS